MFDPWSTLSVFTQPSIMRPLPTRFLDERGLVSRDCLVGLDNLFIEHLWSARIRLPNLPTIPTTIDKWLNTSAMQKAIRRGDAARAAAHARLGVAFDADHTFRRLAVCAVEDVGIGNLLGVGVALAASGKRDLQRSADASAAAMRVAYLLAGGSKSRLACDLLSIVDYDPRLSRAKAMWSVLQSEELSPLCRNDAASVQDRILAQWLLAGPDRYPGAAMPRGIRRHRDLIMMEMASTRLPLMLYYIADRTASRTSDALFVPWLEIGRLLRDQDEFELIEAHLGPAPSVGEVATEAYDMHSKRGRRALGVFAERCEAIQPFLRLLPAGWRRRAVHFAVFIVEGSRLNRRVSSPAVDRLGWSAQAAELSYCGLRPELHRAFLSAVETNLDCLNAARMECN